MKFFEYIKLNWKKILSSLLTFIGLVSAVIGIYSFSHKNRPSLEYQILSRADVLEVKEDLGDLDILFKGNDIKKSGEKLEIVTVKVINSGDANIFKNFYDPNDPVGVKITEGIFAEQPTILNASNDYISRNLVVRLDSQQKAVFSDVILEENDYFTIKFLILSNKGINPKIVPTGKIAGVKLIEVKNINDLENKSGFSVYINNTYKGDILVQILRLLSYFFGGVALLVLSLLFGDFISKQIKKIKRKQIIKLFKETTDYNQNFSNSVLSLFLKNGVKYLEEIEIMFSKQDSFEIKKNIQYSSNIPYKRQVMIEASQYLSHKRIIEDLRKIMVVSKKGNAFIIKKEFKNNIKSFIAFLKRMKFDKKETADESQIIMTNKYGQLTPITIEKN